MAEKARPMSREQALYEICEIAMSVLHKCEDGPSTLFAWASTLQPEVRITWSDSYKKAEALLRSLPSESAKSL